ncbi:SDR family NAD(P)-dependent oxidoreductase [Salinisphaera sp. P385]|uniref:SDR family NAD(P)-dependent oxidoreductase n=1 Tax=Spectribacter acetivorans TaxID=3075603 RepID=A0ABU3B6H8_9GAMM|nr:SDR family NAD(P)-dependent oxidoreductase [Salinisphaera sp. P385]MDT0618052.1 SDR family NAD(P)-dependent oxidoreductase [Salinisphaera sp. P385]
MKDFKNKVAAITGAGSGIGRALAMELGARGCHLALSDVNRASLTETAQLVDESSAVKVTTQVVDVAKRQAVHTWAGKVAAEHGAVHLVFNNAGVALGSTIEGADYDDLEWIMNINFWGVVHGTKAFLPHLRAAGEGHIVNISSVFGIIGVPSQGAYNATKFAVRGFTEALRQELDMDGGGISATSVHPGGIKTNIAQAARFADNMDGVLGGKNEADGKAAFEKLFITTPESAARTILKGVRRDSRRVLIGPDAHAIDAMARLLPSHYQWLVGMGTKWAMR